VNRGYLKSIPLHAVLLCIGMLCACGISGAADLGMDALLQKAGAQVGSFWDDVPSFSCMESVTHEKIGKNGKVEYSQDSLFDYLVITKTEEGDLTVEEVRLPQQKVVNKTKSPALLSTNGFPTLLLIFHPLHQTNYHFQVEPGNAEDGLVSVRFEHIPGTRSTSAIMINGRLYPLDFQGTARIDAVTGAIRSMSAGLVAPMKDINIEKFRVEVTYTPQTFPADSSVRWLPSRAMVEIQTALQHWRNIHFYSQYKRFTVQAVEKASK